MDEFIELLKKGGIYTFPKSILNGLRLAVLESNKRTLSRVLEVLEDLKITIRKIVGFLTTNTVIGLCNKTWDFLRNLSFRDNNKLRYWAYDFVSMKAHFLKKYLYTINHKRIALNYMYFSIMSGLAGALLASFIRLELAYPGSHFFKGDSVRYIQVISSHGLVMIFYVVIPIVFGLFANYFIPFHILAKDVSFPRLNSVGFWILPAGFFLMAKPAFTRRQVYKF